MNKTIKVIDLLNKIANDELEENTKFYDKYVEKEYIYKPQSYAGIYPEGRAFADEDWLLTLHSGSFRLLDEIEIIEDTPKEDKKIEYIDYLDFNEYGNKEWYLVNKVNEIIDRLNGEDNE